MGRCDYVCAAVEGIYTCKAGIFGKKLCVDVCVIVEGMYTCKTVHFVSEPLCLFFVVVVVVIM